MASEENSETVVENDQSEHKTHVSELPDDREARDLLIQKLREGGHMTRDQLSRGAEAFMFPSTSNMFPQMSSSTTNHNPWLIFPFLITTPFPLFWEPAATMPTGVGQSLPGSASSLGQVKEGEEQNVVTLLDTEEAMEFANFDPTVTDDSTMGGGRHHQQLPGVEFLGNV